MRGSRRDKPRLYTTFFRSLRSAAITETRRESEYFERH